MALTTLANVKGWLDITNSISDVLLQRMIDSCSAYIENWLNRKVSQATFNESYDGTGSQSITLRNYPITLLTAVSINGAAQTIVSQADFKTTGVKYFDRQLIGQSVSFAKGKFNISVTYQAGFATVPLDIEQACIEFVALRYKNGRGDRLGVSGKTLATETVSYFQGDMADSTKTLLLQYRNVVPA